MGSFLVSITGAGAGGALAGRGAGGSSRLFHMLTLGGLQISAQKSNESETASLKSTQTTLRAQCGFDP
jgi:hypothetical protein